MSVTAAPATAIETPPRTRLSPLLTGPVIGLAAVLGLFIILIGIKGGLANFLSLRNLQVLVHEQTIPGVVALGMLLVIISGGIDLSVGSILALVTVVTMQTYRHLYTGPESMANASTVAVITGILAGGVCGLANGLIITRLKLQPFVATLGMLGIARGIAIWLAARTLQPFPAGGRPPWVDSLTRVHAGAMVFNMGFWSLVGLAILTAILLKRTVLGRHIYAIGSSEPTARLCGVPIARTKVIVYTLSGFLCGWAGVLLFAHGASGNPSSAEGLELLVIAAVVIGGASLTGGQGTVVGALLGVLILGVLANGVSLFNVPVEIQHILIGVIIIANTALSGWRSRAAEAAC